MADDDRSTRSSPAEWHTAALLAALAHHQAGRLEQAEHGYRGVLATDAGNADAWHLLGTLLHPQGRPDEAERMIRHALSLHEDAAYLGNLARLLRKQGREAEAEQMLRRAVALAPADADLAFLLANMLNARGDPAEAEAAYRQVLRLAPSHLGAVNNLATLLRKARRHDEARALYEHALALAPGDAQMHANRGNLESHAGDPALAEASYLRALELAPADPGVRTSLGVLQLSLGRFDEGWANYQARHEHVAGNGMPSPPDLPRWTGEPLEGRSIILWPEQGYGDYLQFVRHAAQLRQRGAGRVTVFCAEALRTLIASAPGVNAAFSAGPVPHHDLWCYLVDLPMLLCTRLDSIPARLPYLKPSRGKTARWRRKLKGAGFRVGLAWKGEAGHQNDANRSMPSLDTLAPLWSVAGVRFVSLQKGRGEDEARNSPAERPIAELGSEFTDFDDTAAAVRELDLVICVDTSIAHLAGALGKPVWVLLPALGTDWRWLRGRDDSPWYPGVMRLFRQTTPGNWDDVVASVAHALAPLAAGHDGAFERAVALIRESRWADAEAACREILRLHPDDFDTLNNLGGVLSVTGQVDHAQAAYLRSLELQPDNSNALNNLARLDRAQGRFALAESRLRKALALRPDDADALNNLGVLMKHTGRMQEAMAAFQASLALAPADPQARANLGMLHLTLGNFKQGWELWLARHEMPPRPGQLAPPAGQPRWRGEPLAGRSILLVHEQGLGDFLQFIRYARELKKRGARWVTGLCDGSQRTLIASAPGVDEAVSSLELKPHDYWCYMLDLPWHFGTTLSSIPGELPYLSPSKAARDRWAGALPPAGLRVGLVWQGAPAHTNDSFRSIPSLAALAPLWSVPGVQFVSLQKGKAEAEARNPPPGQPLVELGSRFASFDDTAAVVSGLDLVICVDTSVAHLAGALGRPVWVLLPAIATDWRWLQDRDDSPWYPGVMRLFRQTTPGDWRDVVARVAQALSAFVSGKSEPRGVAVAADAPAALASDVVADAPSEAAADLAADLASALAALHAGRLDAAEAGLRGVLARAPQHPDALHLLGVLLQKRGRSADAEQHMRQAIAVRELPLYLSSLALLQRESGRIGDALQTLERAVTLAPKDADLRASLGAALRSAGRLAEAEAALRLALAHNAAHSTARMNLGNLLASQDRHAQAEAEYRRLLDDPQRAGEAHNNLGILLKKTGRFDEAEAMLQRAVALNPASANAHVNLGNLYAAQERLAQAQQAYQAAAAADPRSQQALIALALLYCRMRRWADAQPLLDRALQLGPATAQVLSAQSEVLVQTNRLAEAEAVFRRWADLQPDNYDVHNDFGGLLLRLDRTQEAEASYARAMAIDPQRPEARANLGALLLARGCFEEGLPLYSARLDLPTRKFAVRPVVAFPHWNGEPLAGRSLLLWAEQGFGDTLQFVRYAPMLKALGAARLTLAAPPQLQTLLATADGIDSVADASKPMDVHDVWCFLLEVPRLLGTRLETIPANLPYIHAAPERVHHWLAHLPSAALRVGLVWKGAPGHFNDAHRSLPSLATLAALWSVPDIAFISLQHGSGIDEARDPPANQPLVDLGSRFADFSDTAAVVSQLDLVICVDTSIGHLAGALGKRVWVLLPATGTDWRWLRDRDDSPWYPGVMRLFRQRRPGTWDDVVSDVARELLSFAQERTVREPIPSREDPQDLANHALLLRKRGNDAQAEEHLRRACELAPRNAEIRFLLANVLKSLGRPAEAEEAYRDTLALDPHHGHACSNLGALLRQAGRHQEARSFLERAIAINPELAQAWSHLGGVLQDFEEFNAAVDAYSQALALESRVAATARLLNNRALALGSARRWAEAEEDFRQSLQVKPDGADAWSNLGALLQDMGRPQEAWAAMERALAIDPLHASARTNLGIAMLSLGQLAQGWPNYVSRHDALRGKEVAPPTDMRRWAGEPLHGRSILIWPEQGLGDCLQFVRYAALLKAQGAGHVTVGCPQPLRTLLSTAPGVDSVHSTGELAPHDCWCHFLDLPLHHGTTLSNMPAGLPYLAPSPQAVARWAGVVSQPGLRVGLVWKGAPAHRNDANRSLTSLAILAPLWSIDGVRFFSLQKGSGEDEARNPPPGQPLVELGSQFPDFDDTAAAVSALDLVICVDTSIAHLAGALGKPVWVLLPAIGTDWRWLRDREDSPWYPGVMRLFRQRTPGGWDEVVARVTRELRSVAAGHPGELGESGG